MRLDFTGLNNISTKILQEEEKQAPKKGMEADKITEPIEISIEDLKRLTAKNRSPQREQTQQTEETAFISLKRQQEEHNRLRKAYSDYQENIKKAGSIRSEILKGVRTGEDIHTLFLKAVKCISCMTGEKLFYEQIESDLKAIHGETLLHKKPLEWELSELDARLEKLLTASSKETDTDSLQRINTAIRMHREKRETLKKKIEQIEADELEKNKRKAV